MKPLTVGGLFSGIGGWELGLERAGMEIAWHCEADPFCRKVLEKHWPGVPTFPDVCTLNAGMAEGVDVLCGGFPCQDISLAGKGAGIDGARSGLWSEFARLIGEFRPRYVCVENVSALLGRGLDRVLGDLAALGFDAEWDCIPASAVGAPHQRDRVWLVAYPDADSDGCEGQPQRNGRKTQPRILSPLGRDLDRLRDHVPDSPGGDGIARSGVGTGRDWRSPWAARGLPSDGLAPEWEAADPWTTGEPNVVRMAHGLPLQVDRLRSLGNALVPQVAEWIGRRIVAYEESLSGVGLERR